MLALRMSSGRTLEVTTFDARLDERLGRGTARMRAVADALPPQLQQPRFQAVLFGMVALVGLLLAATGLYAVAAFDVARRRFELAVRLSLGATAADIRRLVVRDTARPVLVGAVGGIVATWWSAQFLERFVFEIRVRDPWTYGVVVAVLITTAILAAWVPACLAGRTDPASVLRTA
jgi:putative ABC transport system permease protein